MDGTITIRKPKLTQVVAIIILLAVSFSAGYFISAGKVTGQIAGDQPSARLQVTANDPSMGSENAPVTIIEFSDFSCPYCGAASGDNKDVINYFKSNDPAWEPAVPGIVRDYVNTGKARLVFKYFPGHGTGQEAMKIALCANEQGKFWDVHGKFFANQDSITDVGALKSMAAQAGADPAKLDQCYASGKYDAKLSSDTAEGKNVGVSGTPTFFVGSEKAGYKIIVGAQPYPFFKAAIDDVLA